MRLVSLFLVGIIMAGCSFGLSKAGRVSQFSSEQDQVVAVVNGRNITLHDVRLRSSHLEAMAILSGHSTGNITLNVALEGLIDTELLISESKRRGIGVSEAEVKSFANMQRSQISQLSAEELKPLKEYLQKRGITQDEFWNEQETIFDPNTLYRGKLRQSISNDLKSEDMNEINKHLQKLVIDLKAKAKISILNEQFK